MKHQKLQGLENDSEESTCWLDCSWLCLARLSISVLFTGTTEAESFVPPSPSPPVRSGGSRRQVSHGVLPSHWFCRGTSFGSFGIIEGVSFPWKPGAYLGRDPLWAEPSRVAEAHRLPAASLAI